MARPSTPLISRRETLEVAIKIVDKEGLDALSIRRIASELGVNGASLYHHFESKDDILAGVAFKAVEDIELSRPAGQDWRDWMVDNADRYRRGLMRHPNVAPLFTRRRALAIGVYEHERLMGEIEAAGVPSAIVKPVVDNLEAFLLGSVQFAVDNDLPETHGFREACRGIIDAVATARLETA